MIVVPTRNMVLYPEMVLPLTVGRPSTVAAIQQAVREQRQIVLLLQRDAENNDPKPTDLYRVGTVANVLRYMTSPEGGHHLVVQGVQRFRVTDFVEGQPFLVVRGVHIAEPTATSPELEARFLVLKDQVRQVFDLLPQVPAEFRADRRGGDVAQPAVRPGGDLSRRHAGREAGAARDGRPAAAPRQGVDAAGAPARGAEALGRDRQQDQGVAGHAPARGAAARADGGDPARAGRGRGLQQAGAGRPREGDRRGQDAARRRAGGEEGAEAAAAHAGGGGRIQHDPHLPRHAARAAVGAAGAEGHRHRRGAQGARRRPFRPRQDQEADRRVPRRAQARAGGQGADPVLRRAAGRRQDLARPVDRQGDGPQVRAGQPGRRARRGGDPRPPAHLYRRAAGQHHPGDPQGGLARLRHDAGRDRQDGCRHPRRSVGGAARGARPGAERHVPRQLSRRSVRL